MKHYGDITKISGHNVPIVDIVCGGSPCQDLSVAGKREGLSGERSGLFMEQLRIIKEMREKDAAEQLSMPKPNEYIRPRFMVWENVPGAFSSNKGEDFRIVLEETAKVVERDACIPGPPNKGKWTPSGCIMGNGWSIAWRVHDAQFWGVPQRRKRISLVADFGGGAAPEILFERKGLSRDIAESKEQGQGIAKDVRASIDEASKCLNSWDVQSKHIQPENGKAEALYSGECRGGGGESYVMQSRAISFQERAGKPGGGKGILIQKDRTGALSTLNNQSVLCIQGNCIDRADTAGCNGKGWRENESYTLNTIDRHAVALCYGLDRAAFNQGINAQYDFRVDKEKIGTQVAKGPGAVASFYPQMKVESNCFRQDDISNCLVNGTNPGFQNGICTSVVRRLTPLECERLQGYPDYWTDIGDWIDSKGKKHKGEADSPRYKALGNSIALPFWQWMAERMVRLIKNDDSEKKPTMASLFDGIGGFPLVYSRCGCVPVWASEIEEFPIAVTRIRFECE